MNRGTSELLKKYKLRCTSCRADILSMFFEKKVALSHSDIEENISDQSDRVTIYRTLKTFLDKGILHKVLDDTGTIKYALCKDCTKEEHNHEHMHFKCIICHRTFCFDEIEIPKVDLPKGYKMIESNLLVQGICKECN